MFWEVLAYSLFYGGVPYAVLAAWATWWVGGRPEAAIRRLMFRAPLLMVAVFVPVALVVGFAVGVPGPFAAVAVLGTAVILPLGYAYVGLAVLLRRLLAASAASRRFCRRNRVGILVFGGRADPRPRRYHRQGNAR